MKIVFFGDSITDAGRNREIDHQLTSYGNGFVKFVSGELIGGNPVGYEIYNRGIGGNRIVDLYARVKADVWNLEPDVLSILIGINDIWHEIGNANGVDIVRFEKIYRMLLQDTLAYLPNVELILCEPFVLVGTATAENMSRFLEVKEYAKVVEKLAKEFGAYFLPLQEKLERFATKYSPELYLSDGVHPNTAGAKLIAEEWLKMYKNEIEK